MPGTDNSLLWYKVRLRADHIPDQPISVLDCFGGHGLVWQSVKDATGRTDIKRRAIDLEKRRGAVRGDNRKWLMSLDLSRYNVIDLDAYGIPYSQTKTLFERQYIGTVFFTFIQSVMGTMPKKMLVECGITETMYKACPTLYGQIGWELWMNWLAGNGVKTVWHRSKDRKHYGCFEMTSRPE